MKQLYILDPFEKLHLEADTSLLLMNEALRRNCEVYSCTEFDIYRNNRSLFCRAQRHESELTSSIIKEEAAYRDFDLESFDMIVIRKDPPFDSSYLTLLLLLLDLRHPWIINNPLSVLRYNEKLSIFLFPEFITETIVTSSVTRITRFIDEIGGAAVLKPLFSCSGRGVLLLRNSEPDLEERIISATGAGREKVMIQRYLSEVTAGETRVFLLEDRPLAVFKKVPAKGSFKANFDFGARGIPHSLTGAESEICRIVGAFCRKEGIILSALDIIGGHLSEFNITSPGLLAESNQVDGARYEEAIMQFVVDRSER
jgi:glutathione synthase